MDPFKKLVLVNAGLVVLAFLGVLAYLEPFRKAQSWENKCMGVAMTKRLNMSRKNDFDVDYRMARSKCGLT